MVPLADEAQVKARFGPIEHSANLDARLVHGSRLTYHRLINHFGRTRCNSYVTWVMWNHTSFTLEIVLGSVQDRCTVCAKHTIGSEIIFDAPSGIPR